MGMWAIFAAPLLMSNDLRKLPRQAKDILLNEKLISINQDVLGGLPGILTQSIHFELPHQSGNFSRRHVWTLK